MAPTFAESADSLGLGLLGPRVAVLVRGVACILVGCMLLFLYFPDIDPTHKGGHVTTQLSQVDLLWKPK